MMQPYGNQRAVSYKESVTGSTEAQNVPNKSIAGGYSCNPEMICQQSFAAFYILLEANKVF